jgi:hypothetical protein
MKNLESIAEEVRKLNDENFESFIAEQILSSKSGFSEDPCFSIMHNSMTIDVWKKNTSYELVKSVIPGAKKAGKDFRKIMKREDIIKEINKILNDFLD